MKLLIANRGEIARRILRAGRERGYVVAVIATREDSDSLVCKEADAVLEVSSFLNADDIVKAALEWKANLVHPGYGFLSENADFAAKVEHAGLTFVGPSAQNILAMGGKESAKRFARDAGVPVLNALFSSELEKLKVTEWKRELDARSIRSPYLVKASAGGGGRGMRVVDKFEDLENAIHRASQEAQASFNDGTVFIENYLIEPRHIEIQVFGDGNGGGVFFGERECSLQRRHQKVVEEAPSAVVTPSMREDMGRAALALVKATQYRGAGTAEFLLDSAGHFYFLEMNTRLQVEHPVTELAYNVDLVHGQLDLAEGRWPSHFPDPKVFSVPVPKRVAIECRVLAEDPRNGYLPTPGPLLLYREPKGEGVRVDSGVCEGGRVNANYDSMIAKLIAFGDNRAEAIGRLSQALREYCILGTITNLPFLQNVVGHPDFFVGCESTSWLGQHLDELNASVLPKSIEDMVSSEAFRQAFESYLKRDPRESTMTSRIFSRIDSRYFNPGAIKQTELVSVVPGPDPHMASIEGPALKKTAFPRQFFYWTRVSAEQFAIGIGGEVCSVDLARQTGNGTSSSNDLEIRAPMAGKVLEVLVREGVTVEQGAVAFVVESMKMQLEVRAKRAGTIDKVTVRVGQILTGPDTMATYLS